MCFSYFYPSAKRGNCYYDVVVCLWTFPCKHYNSTKSFDFDETSQDCVLGVGMDPNKFCHDNVTIDVISGKIAI